MLNYYELKAVDVDDEEDEMFGGLVDRRKPSWDIKQIKNIKQKKNLNDSRENDFEGFEEIFD